MSKLTLEECHDRWKASDHDAYKEGQERSHYLVHLIEQYVPEKNARILELGCNVGRNLEALRQASYTKMTGVEINENSKRHRQRLFPGLGGVTAFFYCPIEEFLQDESCEVFFDLIYTMAALEHIHPDSVGELQKISAFLKPGGHLITIEDEANYDDLNFVFPRSYDFFPNMHSLLIENAAHIPGLKSGYVTRVSIKH